MQRMPRAADLDDDRASEPERTEPIRRRRNPYVVGAADDAAERRADQVADRGLAILNARSTQLPVTASVATGSSSRVQRSTQRATVGLEGGAVDDDIAHTIDGAIGAGRSFEPDVRRRVELATAHDVTDVRVHTDARADLLARSMQASAFTVDRNVFFAAGQYRPDTAAGMHTVLHESAHLAEGAGRVQRSTVRRKVSVTVGELDGSFKHRTGLRGVVKSLSSDVMPKLRDALKEYHATQDGTPAQIESLKRLVARADEWLRQHPKALDASMRSRIDLVDSIRTQASMEYGKAQAASIYMADGLAGAPNNPAPAKAAAQGPGANPLQSLKLDAAFFGNGYDKRSDPDSFLWSKGKEKRADLVAKGELAATDPDTEKALVAGLESLTPAEYAAIHTYTGADFEYINPNIGGWGGKTKSAADAANQKYQALKQAGAPKPALDNALQEYQQAVAGGQVEREEAALHAGFMAQAFQKLPVWTGSTYRGMAMNEDFLGVTTSTGYKANDYWSTSESRTSAQNFISEYSDGKTRAALCTINVVNGRDVSRISAASRELEILLPPGSVYQIAQRTRLERGQDDDQIRRLFGDGVFNKAHITEFWVIQMNQRFSGAKDSVGAYANAGLFNGGKKLAQSPAPRQDTNPWELMGGRKMLFH